MSPKTINDWSWEERAEWFGLDDDWRDDDSDLRHTECISGCEPEEEYDD